MAEKTQTPNAGQYKPGQSGNPAGRPKKGETLAEAIRAGLPPEKVNERAKARYDAAVAKGDLALAQRVDEWLVERGYGKAPQQVDMTLSAAAEPVNWGEMPLAERERLLAALATVDGIVGDDGG